MNVKTRGYWDLLAVTTHILQKEGSAKVLMNIA